MKSKPLANHEHECAECAHVWTCLQGVKCQVETAAKANKAGPFCQLCRHVEMAYRYAEARGVALTVNWPRISTDDDVTQVG